MVWCDVAWRGVAWRRGALRRAEERQLTEELLKETHEVGFDQEAAQARLNEVYERMGEVRGGWRT